MGSIARGGITLQPGAAAPGTNSSKTNMGNKPVNYVWFWERGGLTIGSTMASPRAAAVRESGAYTMGSGLNETRDRHYILSFPARTSGTRPPTTSRPHRAATPTATGSTRRPATRYPRSPRPTPWATSATREPTSRTTLPERIGTARTAT